MWRQLHFKEKDSHEAERLCMSDNITHQFLVSMKVYLPRRIRQNTLSFY